MKIYWALLIVLVVWGAGALTARAQFICHVTEGMWIGQDEYWYTALSCNGSNCFASAVGGPGLIGPDMHLIFLNSFDGGLTWNVQDPGFLGNWPMPYVTTIEQIDPLNVVAFGNAVIFRTSNGGAAWQQDTVPTTRPILDISFLNPLDGFLVAADTVDTMFTTSDGGSHWVRTVAPSMEGGAAQCHDYGQGKYRLFSYYFGQIYTTSDNWQTIDSTKPIISNSSEAIKYGFGKCSFGLGDTIFAYGNYFNQNNDPFPLIARTTDAGREWILVYDDTVDLYGSVRALSDVNRDTIIAGIGGEPAALWSTDHGVTWQIDTLICNDTGFIPASNYGIGLTTQGNLLGTYALGKISSSLIIGRHITSGVISNHLSNPFAQLFPNPTTTSVALTGAVACNEVYLLDLLGREVLRCKVPPSGTLTLDVSHLPRGIYMAILEQDGMMLPAGRIVLVGN